MTALRLPAAVLALLTTAFVLLSGVDARAQAVDIAGNVGVTVGSVISVGGGLAPDSDTTTYSVFNTQGSKKLVGRLSSAMPTNTTLTIQLAAPSGAVSRGAVTLTTSEQELVTGITAVAQTGLSITVTLSATVSAGVIGTSSKTLILTLVDAP